MHDERN